jgi:hypothetical protein
VRVLRSTRVAVPSQGVEELILRRVAERAHEWFPGVGGSPDVRLRRLVQRPRAVLYRVDVGTGTSGPAVLAKVRRDWPGAVQAAGARPRLASSLLPAAEQTALEFDGLTAIHAMAGGWNGAFGAVRPLEHLSGENVVLMDFIRAPTLRDVLVRSSRFSPWSSRSRPADDVWLRAGAWVREYQQRMPPEDRPARQGTRAEVVERFGAFGEFLTTRLGARAAGPAARSGAELAAAVLPERLPLVVGHGDYAPRNVFLLGDRRLAVFDPLPRWRVPPFEDLCRFLVAFRLQGAQLHTRGAAYAAADLDLREQAVIAGYGGRDAVSLAQLRCYQLLITLDKWCALVDSPSSGVAGRLRHASLLRAAGYLREETRRLVRLAESGDR